MHIFTNCALSVVYGLGILTLVDCFSEVSLYSDVKVDYFNDFAQLQTVELKVKPQTYKLHIGIGPHRSDGSCPAAKLIFHLQYGSIPLFNVTNKTFPQEGFYLHRSGLERFTVHCDGHGKTHNMTLPKPGSWFLSAYLDTPTDKKVQKKMDNCEYSFSVNTTAEFLTDTYDLQSEQEVVLNGSNRKYYRFWVSHRVWMYNVSVSLATLSTNQSESQIEVSTRAVNHTSGYTTTACNLTVSGGVTKCELQRLGPLVEVWEIVALENKGSTAVRLCVRLDVSECHIDPTTDSSNHSWTDPHAKPNVSDSSEFTQNDFPHSVSSSDRSLPTTVAIPISSEGDVTNDTAGNTDRTDIHDNKNVSLVTKIPGRTTIRSDRAPPLQTTPVNQTAYHPWNPVDTEAEPGECVIPITLLRKEDPSDRFNTRFFGVGNFLPAPDFTTLLYRLDLHPQTDLGSNLHIQLSLKSPEQNDSSYSIEVTVCIQRWRIPINGTQLYCRDLDKDLHVLTATGSDQDKVSVMYPYPEPGPWFIGVRAQCYRTHNNTRHPHPCHRHSRVGVGFYAAIQACVGCQNDGYCTETTSASHQVAYCHCRARYSGYTCEDDSDAKSLSVQKTYTLLLTCSNLFFLPGITVAVYRRYYVEALVYFANMFFSAFYHSCDMGGWSVYRMCIMPYHVLSYCDFFLSIMSFWVTFVAIADPPPAAKSFLHMLGAIILSMGVEYKATGILTDVIPLSVGGGVVIIAWIIRCIRYKKFHPKKKAFLVMLPGILIAGGGITAFELLETDDNYPYTHSMWHMCIALSIVFLLPLKRQTSDCTDTSSLSSDNNIEMNNHRRSDVPLLDPSSYTAYCDDPDDDPKLEL